MIQTAYRDRPATRRPPSPGRRWTGRMAARRAITCRRQRCWPRWRGWPPRCSCGRSPWLRSGIAPPVFAPMARVPLAFAPVMVYKTTDFAFPYRPPSAKSAASRTACVDGGADPLGAPLEAAVYAPQKKGRPPRGEPAGMLGMIGPQKLILAPSCTRRGARKELISPNELTVMLVLAYPLGSTRLSVLKVSRRSCSFAFPSLKMLKFFIRLASRLEKPGPRTTPRPALPGRLAYCGTAAKQAVLKYRLAVEGTPEKAFGALALGSQIMSGRELEIGRAHV